MSACLQRQNFLAEKEDRLVTINAKILEIKKKIQLSEGQRKSIYEESEAEKKSNAEKIDSFKKEIKLRSQELASLRAIDHEVPLIKKYTGELPPISSKISQQVYENLDQKVIEQRKYLDLMRYERQKRKKKLRDLERVYEDLLIEATKSNAEKIGDVDPIKKRTAQLENEIHRVSIKWNEAELIKKKYISIKHGLVSDAVKFESSMKNIKEIIEKQKDEIEKLQKVNMEAAAMKSRALAAMSVEQAEICEVNEIRRQEIQFFNERFQERRATLEQLEKNIFPAPARLERRGDSNVSDDESDNADDKELDESAIIEDAIKKLMKVTGVTEPKAVLDRFESQKETSKRLSYLQQSTEVEKTTLEQAHSNLLAQLEAFKFADVADSDETLEQIISIKASIEQEEANHRKTSEELENTNSLLMEIKKTLYDLCGVMDWSDQPPIPMWTVEPRDIMDIISTAVQRFKTSLEHSKNLEEQPIITFNVQDLSHRTPRSQAVRSDELQSPAAKPILTYKDFISRETRKPSFSDEEEEIPSRLFLKRQAQVIVDTKSRRKGGRQPYPRKI